MNKKNKVGLYFGSFNPIHIGHLIIANHVVNNTDLNQVWFIVSPHNPLKKANSLLNEYHRLHLVQSAIEGENKLKVSKVEFQLPKPSYTIDTLIYLEEKYPDHEFAILMGSDSLQNINKWKNPTIILKNYQLYIYERPGFNIESNELLNNKNIKFLKAPLLELSSTLLRKMIKENKSIKYLVPDIVKEQIENNGYYR